MGRKGSEPLYLSFISAVTVVNYDRSNACLTRYVDVFPSYTLDLAVSFIQSEATVLLAV